MAPRKRRTRASRLNLVAALLVSLASPGGCSDATITTASSRGRPHNGASSSAQSAVASASAATSTPAAAGLPARGSLPVVVPSAGEVWLDTEEGPSNIVVQGDDVYWVNVADEGSTIRRRRLDGGVADTVATVPDQAVVGFVLVASGMVIADIGGTSFIEKLGGPVQPALTSEDPVIRLDRVAGHWLVTTTGSLLEQRKQGTTRIADGGVVVAGDDDWLYLGADTGRISKMRWDGTEKTELAWVRCRIISLELRDKTLFFSAAESQGVGCMTFGIGSVSVSGGEVSWIAKGRHAFQMRGVGDSLLFGEGTSLKRIARTGGEPKTIVSIPPEGIKDYAVAGNDVFVVGGPFTRGIVRVPWR